MNRRGFLLGLAGAAAGGVALSTQAQAAPAAALWDELQALDAAADLPAEGAQETRGHRRGRYRDRRPAVRYYGRPRRGYAYGYYRRPRRRYRRRVCRLVRSRYGYLVRRCFWLW